MPTASSRFLAESGRIELPRASWLETSGYLEHRAEMAIRELIRQNDPDSDMSKADKVWLQTWIHGHADLINKDGVFPFLNATKREVAQSGHVKIDEVFPQQRFLIVRAKPDHPGRLADQPADLGFRALRLRLEIRLQQAGLLQGLRKLSASAGKAMLWTF